MLCFHLYGLGMYPAFAHKPSKLCGKDGMKQITIKAMSLNFL